MQASQNWEAALAAACGGIRHQTEPEAKCTGEFPVSCNTCVRGVAGVHMKEEQGNIHVFATERRGGRGPWHIHSTAREGNPEGTHEGRKGALQRG